MPSVRINKFLALCGVTSRRGADALIAQQRVVVNDCLVDKVGTIIDDECDVVKVDGTVVSPVREKVHVLLFKPREVVTTLDDPFHRRTVADYLRNLKVRVYPVGRLDYDTDGVLLLTNDGDLAHRLTHPRYEVPKVYEAQVRGYFEHDSAHLIGKGIPLEDGAIGRAKVRIGVRTDDTTRIRLTLTEGRKREVKQLCKAVGHRVLRLQRIKFAGLTVEGLQPGNWRHLSDDEVRQLKELVGL
ncbi:MAG: rRNA pseudouridine synthase [candidate division Zixibacteria bacterium]|nr:rRNA pseudouridine synthase [candidate division Zixibacteria bacterium]